MWYVLPQPILDRQDPTLQITHWPARVIDHVLSSRATAQDNATPADPFAPPTLQTKQFYRHLLELLGTSTEVVCENRELAPWLVRPEIERLLAREQANRVALYESVPLFESLAGVESAIGPWTFAMNWALHIANSYCPMGMYFHADMKAANKPSKEGIPKALYRRRKKRAQEEQRKAEQCYQGLWWAAEKIWVGEVVRLAGVWNQADDGAVRLKLVFSEKDKTLNSSIAPRLMSLQGCRLHYDSHGRPAFFKISSIYRDPNMQDIRIAGRFYELIPKISDKGKREVKIKGNDTNDTQGFEDDRAYLETRYLPQPRASKMFKALAFYSAQAQDFHLSAACIAG